MAIVDLPQRKVIFHSHVTLQEGNGCHSAWIGLVGARALYSHKEMERLTALDSTKTIAGTWGKEGLGTVGTCIQRCTIQGSTDCI